VNEGTRSALSTTTYDNNNNRPPASPSPRQFGGHFVHLREGTECGDNEMKRQRKQADALARRRSSAMPDMGTRDTVSLFSGL
jgi:hypothetical protein